jgi:hypothetical protein
MGPESPVLKLENRASPSIYDLSVSFGTFAAPSAVRYVWLLCVV